MHQALNKTINQTVDKILKNDTIHGFSISVHKDGKDVTVSKGNITENSRFFAASVTKLFVTALILKYVDEGKLTLEDKLVDILDTPLLKGLHTFKGKEYTDTITIRHLLSNNTGLPDYFHGDTMKALLEGKDQVWGFEPVLKHVRKRDAHFIPGHPKKKKYVDTNFQLLGRIIETIGKESFEKQVDTFLVKPLELEDTYVYDGRKDKKLVNMFYKGRELILPKYMASIGPEGAVVSTSEDLNRFLKAFFAGQLFSKEHIETLYTWRLVFGPGLFFYGTGISMQPISLFKMKQGLIGHWGQSGAFAFYYPQKDVYMSGTINSITGHNKAAKVMLKVLKSL